MMLRVRDWLNVARSYDTIGRADMAQKIRDALPEVKGQSNPEVEITLALARDHRLRETGATPFPDRWEKGWRTLA